ncbi:unnamed protein product [Brachionus calyciflorus]|uniref:Uncharacterized protein n=1 Tax=Brachionus calyciflorus TaxID=104777 RepID=A0A814FZE1_9BILA|nr:unnamed protein product [Brachionus calyciflorus]
MSLESKNFVRQVLADRESYILEGHSKDHFYQFEYKVQKSKATCQCEENKYYTKKCVDYSKYGEKCGLTWHCDQSQVLSCKSSICGCSDTKFWSSDNNKCVDRVSHGQSCKGDQCRINVNLHCSSSRSCECTDNNLYYWSETSAACVPKKRYIIIIIIITEAEADRRPLAQRPVK